LVLVRDQVALTHDARLQAELRGDDDRREDAAGLALGQARVAAKAGQRNACHAVAVQMPRQRPRNLALEALEHRREVVRNLLRELLGLCVHWFSLEWAPAATAREGSRAFRCRLALTGRRRAGRSRGRRVGDNRQWVRSWTSTAARSSRRTPARANVCAMR